MKTLFMIYISAILFFNTATGYAAQTAHNEIKKPSGETCKRPPAPPKDKNGHPQPPPRENNSHAAKGQPPHKGKPPCAPPHDNKKP